MPNEYQKDGDIGFVGLNSRDNPSALPKGILSRSQNFRLDRGVAQTRKGLQRKTIGSIVGQVIYATGTYIQSSGQEIIVLVVANGLYTYNPQTELLSTKVYFPNFITGKTLTSSDSLNVTVTSAAHGLIVGAKVYVETTYAGYSGLFTITAVTTNTFSYLMPAVASVGAVTGVACSYSASELIITPEGCDVCNAMDKIFISRGFDKRPLMWDLNVTITALPTSGAGVEFPNCTNLMYYGNRLIAIGKFHLETNPLRNYDTVSVSNFLDYTDWDVADAFSVNNGSNDQLVGVAPWTLNEFLVFMRNSIYYVSIGNDRYVTGAALGTDSYIKTLATDIGCLAKKSVVQAGGGVFFLSDNGVYFLQPQPASAESMKLLTMADPISAPIDDIIQRINRNYASNAVASYWNNRYYLAVPLDDSVVNNTVLVYNFILKNWESVDTYPTLVTTGSNLVADSWAINTSASGLTDYIYIAITKSASTPYHGLAVGDYVNVNFTGQSWTGSGYVDLLPPSGTYKVIDDAYSSLDSSVFYIKIPKSSFLVLPYTGTYPSLSWIYTLGYSVTFAKAESVSLKEFIVVKKDNQRRMFLVDNYQGIFLTEQLDVDEFGESIGNPILPTPIAGLDTPANIALGLYGNLVLVALYDSLGNPNSNVIVLDPLSFQKNNITAVLETRQYTMDNITDKRFSSYEANILTSGGERIETYAEVSNPDVSVRVDSLGSSSSEDYNRSNPIRKTGSGLILKFISYSKRPSIRSAFIYATQQKKNNINKQ
jgi:hypothetical protein